MKNGKDRYRRDAKAGFTLVELIVVIAILALVAALALPRFQTLQEQAKAQVCAANCATLSRQIVYAVAMDPAITPQQAFDTYKADFTCPAGGEISFANGQVSCSIHGAVKYFISLATEDIIKDLYATVPSIIGGYWETV